MNMRWRTVQVLVTGRSCCAAGGASVDSVTDAQDPTTSPSTIRASWAQGNGDQRSASGPSVRLEQLTIGVLEPYLVGLEDPEIGRLTGSRGTFSREVVEQWLLTRAEQTDRVDWAVHRRSDNEFLGEAVLNDIDLDNCSANFRVWLLPAHWGHGYGTEVATLALAHAFEVLQLHRVELSVFAFNPKAQRAYEKAGFTVEGRRRHALRWDDAWHDDLIMAALNPASA